MERGIVLYDFLLLRGGAERVTLDLAQGLPETDIGVAYRNREAFPDAALSGVRCRELGPPAMARLRAWRTLSGLRAFSRKAGFITHYDWAVFSGFNAPVAARYRPQGRNIYYCHTIPRFAYDLAPYYLAQVPVWQRPAFRLLAGYVRRRYEAAMRGMDVIVANSENVRQRLLHYIGLDARVVHPPCDVQSYRWMGQGDYYLSTARLEPYKRVDLVVEAFRRMPDKRLIIASGGSDLPRLERLAAGATNIRFVGWQSAEQLQALVGNAIATVYVARDEDFGMSPVESMAAGKPVIGVAEGGLLETVVHGETGILTPAEPTWEDVRRAVEALPPPRAVSMREACERRAQLFSRERFLSQMRDVIDEVIARGGSPRMSSLV